MALVTLQTIFQDAFPAYEQSHALPAHVRRAAYALMQCRTAALGGPIQACPDDHVSRHAGRGRAHELGEGGAMGAAQGPPPEPPPLRAATAGAERRPGRPSPATSAARPGRG